MTPQPTGVPGSSSSSGAKIDAASSDVARARRAALWVGVWAPLIVVALGVLLQMLWIPRLPDPIATHWSGSGGPDGFSSPWGNILFFAITGIGMTLIFAVILLIPRGRRLGFPAWSSASRFLAAFGAATIVFISVLIVGLVQIQLDVADARTVGTVAGPMVAAVLAAVTAGALGWFVQPKVTVAAPASDDSEPLPLTEHERAVWIGRSLPNAGYRWFAGIMVVLMLTLCLGSLVGQFPGWWVLALVGALVSALIIITIGFRVRIDAAGLEARSVLGWPVVRVRAADIDRVAASEINPLAEFGGWGFRWMPGRFGVVLRTGPGIVVTRRSGSIFGITVDDAETGAAVLAAAARSARTGSEGTR
ncbi:MULTISPECIES: DUF1648 domain-containing protein [unclassified Leucobacter]|nr:DUF1648 domain-containing protein [Leucobacter sp. Ag1]KKI16972.1 hypothetical protein XM48_12330 [Leucobacter sp. Ag1]